MKKILGILSLALAFACSTTTSPAKAGTPITHESWTALLQKHVSSSGCVNYEGFKKDKAKLYAYCELLSKHHPADSWSKDQKYAYWINAYNAYTIKLIVDNYPVKSIKDLGGTLTNKVWDKKYIELGGKTYSLTDIEHNILRPKFKDARVHAAINCASISCPNLYNKAFEAKGLDATLDKVFKKWVNDKSKNTITADKLEISKIFKWFEEDFTRNGQTVIGYINKYSDVKVKADASISYKSYNWNLNKCR